MPARASRAGPAALGVQREQLCQFRPERIASHSGLEQFGPGSQAASAFRRARFTEVLRRSEMRPIMRRVL